MTGTRLYQRRSRARFFLLAYGLLALAGSALALWSVLEQRSVGQAPGFMIVFGAGMFVVSLMKSRKPQVLVHEDFLEIAQTRATHYVRYRHMTALSRPDKDRLVITLRDEGRTENVVIWLRELEPDDTERLYRFLLQRRKQKA